MTIEVRLSQGSPRGEARVKIVPDWPTAVRAIGVLLRHLVPASRIEKDPTLQIFIAACDRADVQTVKHPWFCIAMADFMIHITDTITVKSKSR